MSEADIDGVIETIDSTNKYCLQLSELLESLDQAKAQVKQTAHDSSEQLKEQFAELKSLITQALDDRELELLHELDTVENTALNPLLQCEDLIRNGLAQAGAVMSEGKSLLMSDHEANKDNISVFSKKVNDLELNSLPEVPNLSDVSSLSVQFSASVRDNLLQQISEYGTISSHSPVKIVSISPRPGALLVTWAEVEHDDEHAPDITEFQLQYVLGDGSESEEEPSYETIYQGPNMSYLVRHIKENTPYTFWVCCRGDCQSEWSTWCVPQIAMTTLKHNDWCRSVSGYTLRNDNRVASIESSPDIDLPVLYSSSPSYTCGHSLEFSILDRAEEFDDGGIGLSFNKSDGDTLLRPGALFVNSLGQVYVDGKKLTIVLPALTQGSTLTFNTELVPPNKIRVSIETNEKQVTVDWKEETESSMMAPPGDGIKEVSMYFALQFQSVGWKVLVQ